MATDGRVRIARLRMLIDHPRTGAAERAAAQRMLDRLLGRSAGGDQGHTGRHSRVGRHARIESIAEAIRDDIMVRRAVVPVGTWPDELVAHDPIRDAPAEITFGVGTPHDGSVVVSLGNVPRDWGWDTDGVVGPSLRRLASAVSDLMNSYNGDGSDSGRRFFGTVRIHDAETLVWR